jgi:cytochrome b6-f complex iron-sulfur subunit
MSSPDKETREPAAPPASAPEAASEAGPDTGAGPGPEVRAPEEPWPEAFGRRDFLTRVGTGVVAAAFGVPALLAVRSCIPEALYEEPRRVKVGPPDRLTEGPTFFPDQKVFVFREEQTFHCLSAVCTHLGCTVQLARLGTPGRNETLEFHCPCHGSKYHADGTPYAGPAPRPLTSYRLELAPDDPQLVVDRSRPTERSWRFTV